MDKINIVTITGYSCAGKSTLIKQIAKETNLDIIKYRDIHIQAIKNSGYTLGLDWIKERGFEDYENGVLPIFIEQIENNRCKNIIVDGIFSNKCYQYLVNKPNINLTNIVLETDFENRLKRLVEREGIESNAKEHLETVDWIKCYAGLSKIIEKADYIIDSGIDKKEITRKSF